VIMLHSRIFVKSVFRAHSVVHCQTPSVPNLRTHGVSFRKFHTLPFQDFSLWAHPGLAMGVGGYISSLAIMMAYVIPKGTRRLFQSPQIWANNQPEMKILAARMVHLESGNGKITDRVIGWEEEAILNKQIGELEIEMANKRTEIEKRYPNIFKRVFAFLSSYEFLIPCALSLGPGLCAGVWGHIYFSSMPDVIPQETHLVRQLILSKALPIVFNSTNSVLVLIVALGSLSLKTWAGPLTWGPLFGLNLAIVLLIFLYGFVLSLFTYPITIPIAYFISDKIIQHHASAAKNDID